MAASRVSLAPARLRDRAELRFGAFFGPLALLGLVLPSYELLSFNQHLLIAVNVLALNFCLGLGGQVSLAQGAFCGLGAYVSALLHQQFPAASIVILPATVLLAYGLGALVSRPLETLGEGFLAMATLGVGLVFMNVVISLEDYTGGGEGMVVNEPLAFLGLTLTGDRATFFAFLLLLLAGAYVFRALADSRLGRALKGCRADTEAAAACGVNRPAVRSLAFGLGASFSALAGAIYAPYSGFISPGIFGLELSLKTLLFLVIGGPGRLFTPLLAVLALELVLARLDMVGDAKVLLHGLLLGGALLARGYFERRKLGAALAGGGADRR